MIPQSVEWSGNPRAGFNAALREAVGLGFDVTMMNAEAGVLKAERIDLDREETKRLEQMRIDAWNGLTPSAQDHARRRQSTLLKPVVVRRKLSLSLAIGRDQVVGVPGLAVCIEQGGENRCAEQRTMTEAEGRILLQLFDAVRTTGKPEPSPALPPADLQVL